MTGGRRPYPAYRDSGAPSVGEIPAHWEAATLGRLGRIFKGRGGNKQDEVPEGVPCVRYGDLYTQYDYFIERTRSCISSERAADYTDLRHGDVLFAASGETMEDIGKSAVNLLEATACCGGDVLVFRTDRRIFPKFLGYALGSPRAIAQKATMGRGFTVFHIYAAQLKNLWLPLPPFAEQVAIARYLDDADKRIRRYIGAKERSIELLREKKRATVARAVTRGLDRNAPTRPTGIDWMPEIPAHWGTRRLGTLAELRISNVDKHVKAGEQLVRLCNYVDVYKNDYIDQNINFMNGTAAEGEIERFRLEQGDVLITKDSEAWNDIGVPALVTEAAPDLVSGYHLALLRPRADRLSGDYLFRALQSSGMALQFHLEAKGVTRYGLSRAGIKAVRIPLPPLDEQAAIVERLEKASADLDAAIVRARRQIELLREYRERLIADVVAGKLDVRPAGLSRNGSRPGP